MAPRPDGRGFLARIFMKAKRSGLKNHYIQSYAHALFELAKEQNSIDKVLADFELLHVLQQQVPDLNAFFALPFFEHEKRLKFIDDVIRRHVCDFFSNFLKILLDKNQFQMFPEVFTAYREQADEYAKRARAIVTSAFALSPETLSEISSVLQKIQGKTVLLENSVAPEIGGGFIIQMGDLWINASLQRQLELLRRRLLARGCEQLHKMVRDL